MSHFLRILTALAVAMTLALGPVKAVAVTKPEPAAQSTAPADAITATDVRKLQEAIKTLHDRFEGQGKILERNSDEISTLTKRVEDYLKPSTLKPVEDGLVTVVKKLGDLQVAMGNLADTQGKQASETSVQLREASAALARLQEQLAKSDQAADASIVQLRKDIAASRTSASGSASPPDPGSPLLPIAGIIAAAMLLLVMTIILAGRAQLRAQRAAIEKLMGALAQARAALLTEFQTRTPPATATAGDLRAAGNTDNLAEIREKLQSVIEHLTTSVPPVHSDDHTTKTFPEPNPDDKTTARSAIPVGSAIPATACWTAAFFDPASPMAAWRARIESHLTSAEHPAMPVFSAFLALRMLCTRQPVPQLAEVGVAVLSLSQALYAYWESLPDIDDDVRARASSDWIQAVKTITISVAPKLEIREIPVGARFDSDSMQTVQDGPGNHLTVAAVFSWATLDRSGERVKVLQRARIATN
jgi:hypothetical protein